MSIDISDLNIPDVLIIAQQKDIIVTSSYEDVLDDVRDLPCPIKVLNNGPNTEIISCDCVDWALLAERLATTWESREYKVLRVYTPDNAYNRKPIPSFLLV